MSIVRIGLAETKKFADGYEAIFGKAKNTAATPKAEKKKGRPAKKKAKRK